MKTYLERGIVLRTQPLGEADRIITLLTRGHGQVRAVAKGVRRTQSRFGARLEPFAHVDVQLYRGRSLDTITQVVTRDAFGQKLLQHYARFTVGQTMLETAEKITAEVFDGSREQLDLLHGGLYALVHGTQQAHTILDSYLIRAIALAGWEPILDHCVRCDEFGEQPFISVAAGGVLCLADRVPGAVRLSPPGLRRLGGLLAGDWAGLAATDDQAGVRREASGFIAAYVQWHLERGLRSLPFVEREES